MPFIEDKTRLSLDDLHIQPSDKSKRLDQEALEDFWAFKSHDRMLELPIWAKGDGMLQQITHTKSSPSMTSSPFNFRSTFDTLTAFDSEEDAQMSDFNVSAATNPKVDSVFSSPPHSHGMEHNKQLGFASSTPRRRWTSTRETSTRKRERRHGNRANIPPRARKYRVQKSNSRAITKIQETVQKPFQGTRSHRVTMLYELDRNGTATALPNG